MPSTTDKGPAMDVGVPKRNGNGTVTAIQKVAAIVLAIVLGAALNGWFSTSRIDVLNERLKNIEGTLQELKTAQYTSKQAHANLEVRDARTSALCDRMRALEIKVNEGK